MAKLKIGRKTFEITEKDVVLFNGSCWQLISQKVYRDWHYYSPSMSKVLCEKLLKKDVLILVKSKDEFTTQSGKQMGLYYYKFNMDKLQEYLSSEEDNR